MPTDDSISKLFELEDIILNDLKIENEEIRIFFSLERRDVSCPYYETIYN